jgi:hypothetical protein
MGGIMKRYVICCLLLVSSVVAQAEDLACTGLSGLNNKLTPVDLAKGTIDCIKKGRFEDGVSLYLLFGAYGWFDTRRVVDESAHQAIPALKMYISAVIAQGDREKKWIEAVDRVTGEKNLARFCAAVKKIGMPVYYPDYMIKHGLAAFNNPEKATVYSDFDGPMVWHSTLQGYLKCTD